MRVALLLALVVAVAAVALLLVREEPGGEAGALERTADGEYVPGDLREAEEARLSGAEGARSAEEIAAERAAREAERARPAFPRSEGVFGRVTDARDQPVSGATVKLMVPQEIYRRWGVPDPPPIATAVTDAEGGFLVGPAPEGRLRIRAEAEGYAPTIAHVKRRGYRVDVILDRGGALDVTVKDAKGGALAGARVLHQAGDVITDDLTTEDGHVLFPGLPTGTGTLFVSAEGHAGIQQGDIGITPGETQRRTVVLGKPLVVVGKVLDGETERPVEGARITMRFPGMPWVDEQGPILTDDGGSFETEIPLPVGQSMDLEVKAAGYATTRAWYQATDAGDGRMSLEMKLTDGAGNIRGEVVDARGFPLGGVRVTYMERRGGEEAPETTTAADGMFTLPPTPWSTRPGSQVQVVAISESGGVGVGYAQLPKDGERGKPITIRLSGTGIVTGRVTDADEAPVSGALVSLLIDWNETMRQARNRPGAGAPWQVMTLVQDPRYVRLDDVTDEDGRYRISGVPLACYRVSASFGIDTVTAEESVTVESDVTITRDVTLGEGASIEGWVNDGEGLPIAGARVQAYAENRGRGGPISLPNARSQSDGHFVLHGVPEGTYTLRAWAAGYESQSQQGVAPGQGPVTLTMTALGWIEGVVSYQGRPYQGTFSVFAKQQQNGNVPPPPTSSSRFFPGGGRGDTFHTDDGRFTLRNLQAGEYDVSAQTPDGLIAAEAIRVRVSDGRASKVALGLVGGAVLSGTLVDDATSEPITGAQISVRGAPGDDAPATSAHVRTDKDGRFVARGLSTGRYVIQVHPPSGIAFHQSLEIQAGESRTVSLRERATGAVRILVRDDEGRPVGQATPRVKGESGLEVWPSWQAMRRQGLNPGNRWSDIVRTDDNGVNLRSFVPPGRYQVSADKPGMRTVEPRWIEVHSGRVTEVELVLAPVGGSGER